MKKPHKKTFPALGSRQLSTRRKGKGQDPGFFDITSPAANSPSSLVEKYTELYDLSPSGYFTLDQHGVILELNLTGALLLGKERSSLNHQSFSSFVADTHQEIFENFLKNIFTANVKTSTELLLRNDFNPFMLVHIDAAVTAGGMHCLLAVADVSERRKAEAALKRKQEIFDLSQDLHCIIDQRGYFNIINPAWARTLGWTNAELMGKPSIDFVHPEDRHASFEIREQLRKGAGMLQFENRLACKNGAYKWLEWNSILNPTDNTIISVGRDVTERKQAEDENRKLAMIASLTVNAVILTDAQGVVQWVNKGFERLTQYSLADILNVHLFDCCIGSERNPEAVMYMRSCMRFGKGCKLELVNLNKSGMAYWVDVEMVPMRSDKSGAITGFMVFETDISERKRAETELLHQNLDLNKRTAELILSNEELERFAYVASHDLQEPLRMVSSFLQLLKRNYEPLLDEKAKEYVRYAVDGTDRMKKLIMDLLEYSRVGTSGEAFQAVDLNHLIHELEMIFDEPGKENELTLTYPKMPVIHANRSQLVQLFQNLLGNALKYRSDLKPRVEISFQEEEQHYRFCVSDNGIGISSVYFDKIFILFQRLHVEEEYSGTGIGLAVCKKIVELHDGTIWVESTEGKGSNFFFTIRKPV